MKIALALITLGLVACQTDPGAVTINESTQMNVAYGTDPAQKMDVYLPANRNQANTKVIILIHGGAWATGDKSDFNVYVDTLKKRLPGYAIFNINYRLATGTANFFPAQENDVKAAVEFIFNKRAEYLLSDKFVLLGASAGGHLALLQAYKYSSPVKFKAVVSFFGPTDITELYNHPASAAVPPSAIASIVGATPTVNPTLYQQSSPITFVDANSPPTILLHGGLDPLVAVSQSTTLRDKLLLNGVTNQYVFYPTEGHEWFGANLTDSFNKLQAFLAANVN
jgi:acetyl esterase/lipase